MKSNHSVEPLQFVGIALLGALMILAGCATPSPQMSEKSRGPGSAATYYSPSPNQPSPYNTQAWPYTL